MKIDPKEVAAIAHIARIATPESELEGLSHQLGEVLSYAQCVVDCARDNATAQQLPVDRINVVRPDVAQESPVDIVLAVAPAVEENYYVVPKILENTK